MTINLFGQPETPPPLPDDVQYFDIANEKVCTQIIWLLLHVHVYRIVHCLIIECLI